MQFAIPTGPAAHKETTDRALIEDVIATLKTGKTTISVSIVPTDQTNWKKFSALVLFSDELPGLIFCPGVYMEDTTHFYLGMNQNAGQWIPAGDRMTLWMQTE